MDIPFVQILNGKAKFIVVPHNIAEHDLETFEQFLVEKFTDHRIMGTIQETVEIDGLLRLIGKRKMNLMFSQILCLRNGNGFHGIMSSNFFVILSGRTGLL